MEQEALQEMRVPKEIQEILAPTVMVVLVAQVALEVMQVILETAVNQEMQETQAIMVLVDQVVLAQTAALLVVADKAVGVHYHHRVAQHQEIMVQQEQMATQQET